MFSSDARHGHGSQDSACKDVAVDQEEGQGRYKEGLAGSDPRAPDKNRQGRSRRDREAGPTAALLQGYYGIIELL